MINARFAKPIDEAMIKELEKSHKLVVTMEENVQTGGFGEQILECVEKKNLNLKVLILALPDEYVEHGNVQILRKETGIDAATMTERIQKEYDKLQVKL